MFGVKAVLRPSKEKPAGFVLQPLASLQVGVQGLLLVMQTLRLCYQVKLRLFQCRLR